MSFLIDYYYLIEPASQLTEQVRAALDPDFASVVLERVVVAKRHIKLHGADDANAVALKLGFLSKLLVDLIWDTPKQFEELFGSAVLAPELFDRWWTLTEIEFTRFEEWEPCVRQATPFIRSQADPRVAAWLAEYDSDAKSGSTSSGGGS